MPELYEDCLVWNITTNEVQSLRRDNRSDKAFWCYLEHPKECEDSEISHWIYVKDVPKPESEFTKLMDELEKTKQLIPGFFRLR